MAEIKRRHTRTMVYKSGDDKETVNKNKNIQSYLYKKYINISLDKLRKMIYS